MLCVGISSRWFTTILLWNEMQLILKNQCPVKAVWGPFPDPGTLYLEKASGNPRAPEAIENIKQPHLEKER